MRVCLFATFCPLIAVFSVFISSTSIDQTMTREGLLLSTASASDPKRTNKIGITESEHAEPSLRGDSSQIRYPESRPTLFANYRWLTVAVLFCISGAAVLVWKLRHHVRFGRGGDLDGDFAFPLLSRITNTTKLALRLFFVAAVLSLLSVAAWQAAAPFLGRPLLLAALSLESLIDFFRQPVFGKIVVCWSLALSLLELWRSARTPLWDVFLSYKSEDVALARRIAEYLMSHGIKVWFNEYYVLLQNYERFQKAIDYGTHHSAYGIALTNDRWVKSNFCRKEIEQLLRYLPADRLLEIKVPPEQLPHNRYPALKQSPNHVGDDFGGIISFLSYHTGWPLAAPKNLRKPECERTHETVCLDKTATLDVGGWKLTDEGKMDPRTKSIQGLEFRYVEGQFPLVVNLFCGQELSRPGQRQQQTIEDRQMWDYLRKYAPSHFDRLKESGARVRPRGLHLLFHQRMSHFGLSYQFTPPGVPIHYWSRKYSIVIPNESTTEMAEFVFTFGLRAPFWAFVRCGPIMDRFVMSLRWE